MYKLENDVEWTDELKEAFKRGTTRAKILYDNIEIHENNYLQDLTLKEPRYVTNYGFVGTATARQLEVNLLDINRDINLENKEITLKIGADYEGDTYYINYGNFIVDKSPEHDETNGKTRIVLYDYMIKFNKPYEDRVTYPCTLAELTQDICNQAEVILGDANFTNSEFVVTNNQFEGMTLREVLQNIAKCAFSWARIGQDNKLYLDFDINSEHTENVTIDDYKLNSFKKANEYYGPVNQVTYADTNIEGQEERIKDQESIDENGLKEIVIYDNYFAYTPEKRAELIQGGAKLLGLKYMPVSQLESVGFIYLDCRDTIQIGTTNNELFITRVFNHEIVYNGTSHDSITAEGTSDNEEKYKNTATTIFQNQQTRIIVDRHGRTIDQLVSDMYEEDGVVHENFTQVHQDIDNISNSVQNSGGVNLIKNSVMFAYDNEGNPDEWQVEGSGTLVINSSPESMTNGGISGHVFTLNDKKVIQRVAVKANTDEDIEKTYYTFSTRIKKNATGSCYVKIYNSNEEYLISIPNGEEAFWKDYEIRGMLPTENYYDIEFYGSSDSDATFTDNMLNVGETKRQWQQASGEIMNTQVNVNINGVTVKSSVYQGDYTVMSPLEFAGYSNINGVITKVFTINKDTTEVEKLRSKKSIAMPPIKIVPITTGNMQGWAFVPYTE